LEKERETMEIFLWAFVVLGILGLLQAQKRFMRQERAEIGAALEVDAAEGRLRHLNEQYCRIQAILKLLAKEGDFSRLLGRLEKKMEVELVWVICPNNGCNVGGPFTAATVNHQEGQICQVCSEFGTYTEPADPIYALNRLEREVWAYLLDAKEQ